MAALRARLGIPAAVDAGNRARPAFPAGLTARKVEVLGLLASGATNGATNKEIAAALVVAPGTITQHLVNIYTKIGARRRADAVAFTLRHGLVPPSQP